MDDRDPIDARRGPREVQRLHHIGRVPRRPQRPGQDVRQPQPVRVEIRRELLGEVARAVVTEQARAMDDRDPIDARRGPREVQRLHHIGRVPRRPQRPGQDVPRVVVEHRREVRPAPPDDMEIREVGLPELVGAVRGMGKRFRRREHDEGRTGDQVVRLQDAIHA